MLYFGLTMFLDCGFMRNCPLTILENSSFESTRQIAVKKNKNNRTDTDWTEGHKYLVTQLPSKILPIPIKQSSSELVQTIKNTNLYRLYCNYGHTNAEWLVVLLQSAPFTNGHLK